MVIPEEQRSVEPDSLAPAAGVWWMIPLAGIATQFLIMVNGVVAARMLGVEGRGQVVMVAILAGAASQLTLGGSLPNAVTHQLAEAGRVTRDGLRGFAGRWSLWAFLAGVAASLYLVFLERDSLDLELLFLALTVIGLAMTGMGSRIMIAAMLAEGTSAPAVALTSLLPQIAQVTVMGTALAVGLDFNAVAVLTLTMVSTAIVLVYRLRTLKPSRGAPPLDRAALNAFARRTHIGSVGPIDGLGIDRILLGSLLGSAALGLYSAAWALGGLTNILAVCLALVCLPRITQLQSQPAEERAFVARWLTMSAIVIGGVAVVLVVLVEPIIRLTFGPEFLGAVGVGRWLVVGCALLGFRRVLTAVLQGRGRGGVPSLVELALVPVMVVGIAMCAAADSLVGMGIVMTVVGACSVVVQGVVMVRSAPVEES